MLKVRRWQGIYHCPHCWLEVELKSERSRACPDCEGLLVAGPLPEEASEPEEPEVDREELEATLAAIDEEPKPAEGQEDGGEEGLEGESLIAV